MPKERKVCRICGDTYEACRTAKVSNTFRWQDVSCSPTCGAEYLRRITLSREVDSAHPSIIYNEEINGFTEDEIDEEYINEFGLDNE